MQMISADLMNWHNLHSSASLPPLAELRETWSPWIRKYEAVSGYHHFSTVAILVINKKGAAAPFLGDLVNELALQLR